MLSLGMASVKFVRVSIFRILNAVFSVSNRGRAVPQLVGLSDRPAAIADIVYERLREAIIDKTLPPGEPLAESKLAKDLNVSKTPVRESLLRLHEQHLLEPDGVRGLRVPLPSRVAIIDAYEVRIAHEVATARLAADRMTAETSASIQKVAAATLASAEGVYGGDFRALDRRFHELIADASGNQLLAEHVRNSLALTGVLRARDAPVAGDSKSCAREHVGVADSLARGKGEKSARQIESHIRHILKNVLLGFESLSTTSDLPADGKVGDR